MPGVAVARIAPNDVEVAATGLRRSDAPDALQSGDRFHIGSINKSLTALLAGILVDAGVTSWDAQIGVAFPELLDVMHPAYRTTTLAELLAHRAGVIALLDQESLGNLPSLSVDPTIARSEFTRWALQRQPEFAAGSDASYSNGGYAVAAAMLERMSGVSYESLVTQRLLRPLSIPPRFSWPAQHGLMQPWGHTYSGSGWIPNDPDAPENAFPQFLNPAGNLSLSLPELAKFVQLHLRGLRGNCAIAQSDTFLALHTPLSSAGYSLGWLEFQEFSYVAGSAGTFYVIAILDRTASSAAVVATNAARDDEAFTNLLNSSLASVLAVDVDSERLFSATLEGCGL